MPDDLSFDPIVPVAARPGPDFDGGARVEVRRLHWGEDGDRIELWRPGHVVSKLPLHRQFLCQLDSVNDWPGAEVKATGEDIRLEPQDRGHMGAK